MNATLPTPDFQAELDVEIAADHIDAEQTDIEQANLELVVAEAMTPGDLSLEEIIMKEGRRSDGEVVVKLNDEQIKEKHDKFHEIYREQVLDNLEFAGLRKDFSLRKKTREADMQKLDNCLVRGEETQCVTRWRIAAHKLKGFIPEFGSPDLAEEALIFDSDFNLIDRVPLTEMERQMQISYEDVAPFPVPTEEEVAAILAGDEDSETSPEEEDPEEGFFEAPEAAEPLPNSVVFKDGYAIQAFA
jgi:hypothetical protein